MNNSILTDTYVLINPTSLSKPLCNEIIERFEREEKRRDGRIMSGVNKEVKDTIDFHLSDDIDNWKDIDKVLSNELNKALEKYIEQFRLRSVFSVSSFSKRTGLKGIFGWEKVSDKGFQIQRYEKGVGKYTIHHDYIYNQEEVRLLTYLWYLNTIEEGGQTDFVDRGMVKAEQGKLILFPACWTYPHAGVMPISSSKYIITGWIVVPTPST